MELHHEKQQNRHMFLQIVREPEEERLWEQKLQQQQLELEQQQQLEPQLF
jgi:hypothetical protein